MKFILGFIKGSKSSLYKMPDGSPGPKLYFNVRADHGGSSYEFERFERDSSGVFLPRLRVYDSDDYPDDLIRDLLNSGKIVETITSG